MITEQSVQHAEERRAWARAQHQPSYRERCTPDQEWQRCKTEQLRYKWFYLGRCHSWMQRLGDIGRDMLPWLIALRAFRR